MPRKAAVKGDVKDAKIVKKLPATENGPGVLCKTKSGQEYTVSWCLEKMRFTLWRKVDGGYQQLGTAKSPLDLYPQIPWDE